MTINNNRQSTTSLTRSSIRSTSRTGRRPFTQPLLRNFQVDNTRQQLVVTKLNQDISEIQLQASIINTISNVRNAYWDYVFAVQSVEVARRSVELAEQLVKDNQTRVEIGTMAPIDVVQAQSQAATQRQNLATAAGHASHRRADAQAAHRRRHAGSELECHISNPPINPTSVPSRSTSKPPSGARSRRAPTWRRRKKNLQVNDVTLQLPPEPDAAAGGPHGARTA